VNAVVAGDEVDAVDGLLPARLEDVGAPGNAGCDGAHAARVPPDEGPDVVAVRPVPLGPPGAREVPDLVEGRVRPRSP
jgi:hypothetical protein